MKGKVYEMVTKDGLFVCRHRDKECGPITLEQTGHRYEFVLGCQFTSKERAEKFISNRLGQAVKAVEANRVGEFFYA